MSQLALFEAPPPARSRGGMPRSVEAAWERGFSEPVKLELIMRLNERPGEWLKSCDFADIRERHNIGCCIGHVLFSLAHAGRALTKNIYYGAERPGDPFKPYLGFNSVYSSIEHGPAPERKTRTT